MAEENDPIASEIDAFATARTRSVATFDHWPQEKRDLIAAIVKHNSTPGKAPLSLIGAVVFLRERGHSASEGGLRSYCRIALGIEWGAWP